MKSRHLSLTGVKSMFALALLLGTFSAQAQFSITPSPQATICNGQASATFSVSQNNSFPFIETESLSGIVNSVDNPGSPATGSVTYAGVPFQISSPNTCWDGYTASGFTNVPVSATVNIPCPKSVSTLYTLINTGWGESAPGVLTYLRLAFTNGTTALVPLDGNVNIRDHRKYSYTNSIGSSVNNGFPISTQQVWGYWSGTDSFRRDMQTITIPAPYNAYFLSSVTVLDSGATNVQRTLFTGLSIATTAPAPITWHAGSASGPVVTAGPAPSYTISVSPGINTTYYAVTDGGGCIQTATVTVQNCCSDTCFWKVTGNNIINGNNIFGTLTKNDVKIQTMATNRGILTSDGRMGWSTMAPTTLFHIYCGGQYQAPSDIRFEKLPTGHGRVLVIDDQGYVFATDKLQARMTNPGDENLSAEIAQLKEELAALKQQLGITSTSAVAAPDMIIYPNPARNNLGMRISGEVPAGAEVIITDVQGRKLLSNAVSGKESSINISALVPGTYSISLMANGKSINSKKFVVEK